MHLNIDCCIACEDKLKQCHPLIIQFYDFVKKNHIDVHVAWGFRNQLEQHMDYIKGKSKLDWPNSKHNHMEGDASLSLAIDIFRLDDQGHANFELSYYDKIWQETVAEGLKIRWGGTFSHFHDYDHFEVAGV